MKTVSANDILRSAFVSTLHSLDLGPKELLHRDVSGGPIRSVRPGSYVTTLNGGNPAIRMF